MLNNYQRLETVLKKFDYLGLHLNNRFAYLQYHQSRSPNELRFDHSNKFLLLSILAFSTLILIGIACLFMSLLKCKTWRNKGLLKPAESISSTSQHMADSSTLNLYKPATNEKKSNLRVINCYDYNDASLVNDNSSLLNTMNEKEIYDQQRNKVLMNLYC